MNCFKCKHEKEFHVKSKAYPGENYCSRCLMVGHEEDVETYHKFPDNLDLIEHLAKERNFI